MTSVTQKADMDLSPAIVIAGASSGIGREIARVAAREKAPLLLVSRSNDVLAELVDELRAAGTPAAHLECDLRDRDAAARIDSTLADRGWYCDVLVLSAGIGLSGAFHRSDRNDQLAVLDLNTRVLTELALHFMPAMHERRRGGMLLVGSLAAYGPGPNMAVYYASKAYVRSLANALYAEAKGSGLTVTNLSPGIVRTPFLEHSGLGRTRLRKILPRMTAAQVAEAGWRGFRSGRRLVIPGLANRLLIGVAKLMPTGVVLWLVHRLQHQRENPPS